MTTVVLNTCSHVYPLWHSPHLTSNYSTAACFPPPPPPPSFINTLTSSYKYTVTCMDRLQSDISRPILKWFYRLPTRKPNLPVTLPPQKQLNDAALTARECWVSVLGGVEFRWTWRVVGSKSSSWCLRSRGGAAAS